MTDKTIGVLGATSFVGEVLLELLNRSHQQVFAYSRRQYASSTYVQWRLLPEADNNSEIITDWLSLAPIWTLPEYFPLLEQHQVRRVVVLSSTSRFTKLHSADSGEQALVKRLIAAEEQLQTWATSKHIDWVILRPTLIYGYGLDANVSVIAKFIRRFGFFPLLGKALGLRQPIHVDDVAQACLATLVSAQIKNQAYNISGAEVLSYREMVVRIFAALNRKPRFLTIPRSVFGVAVACLRILPRYRNWTSAMAERMNQDLVFEHSEAGTDFNFSPKGFVLSVEDLPKP